jgi:hypothetical protein
MEKIDLDIGTGKMNNCKLGDIKLEDFIQLELES